MIDVEYAKTVLSKPDLFVRYGGLKKLFPLLGDSLLTVEGEEHRYQKKILSKGFNLLQMRFYLPVVKKHGDILIRVALYFLLIFKSVKKHNADYFCLYLQRSLHYLLERKYKTLNKYG